MCVKVYERLWCSVSALVGAVLAAFSLVPESWRGRILLLVFAVWGLWAFTSILLPRIVWRVARRHYFAGHNLPRRRAAGRCRTDSRTEEALVRHVNYRISAYIQSAYPEASWEWVAKDPARLIVRGGKGRILLHGVPDYNYAEVDLRPNGHMECSLLRVVPFPTGSDEQEAVPKADEQFNPQVWFEVQGRQVLEDLVADLGSRGHNSLVMNEDGSITVEGEYDGKAIPAFTSFPSKVHWPQTVRVLEGAGYAADVDGDGIRITL